MKLVDSEDVSIAPEIDRIPFVPPGMWTEICSRGTKKPAGWNTSLFGEGRDHVPGTEGVRVGMGMCRASGSEKSRSTDEAYETSLAPDAGN